MSRFIAEADRSQGTLLPESINEYVSEENPVRVIEAFVDALGRSSPLTGGPRDGFAGTGTADVRVGESSARNSRTFETPTADVSSRIEPSDPRCRFMWHTNSAQTSQPGGHSVHHGATGDSLTEVCEREPH